MTTYSDDRFRNETQAKELSGILTKDAFIELASYDKMPCISILLPTHKAGVQENEQGNSAQFRNALQQVEKMLKAKGAEPFTIKSLLQPGSELLNDEPFWHSLNNGLAVYIADGFCKYIKLQVPLIQYIQVNNAFYLSPLVPFMVKEENFYLLDLEKKYTRFYRADSFGIEQLNIAEIPSGDDDVAYLEEVDNIIWLSHLNRENIPLLLAGQESLIPIYRSVSQYKNIWPEDLTGNHHQQHENVLYEEARKVMKRYFDQPVQYALEDYRNKLATDLTSSMIETIIPATYYAKVSHLFVKNGMHIWGSFNEQENKLELQELENGTVMDEDLIDKAVIKTIQNGGEVYFLEAAQMPNESELAAIFRY